MSKYKSRTSKLALLVIGIILVFILSLIFTVNNGISAFAAETEAFTSEAKIFSRVTLNEEFDDSSVIVVMDKRVGGANKRHEDSFFGNFAKKAVYDLTYTEDAAKSRASVDDADFSQILKIELPVNSKENVIDVIRQLEKIDGILAAEPNYIFRPALQPPSATTPATGVHRYPNLWGMHGGFGIQAEEAWNFTTGVRNNVRVGVIDSGMDNHADIAANRVNEGGDFVNMTNVNQNIPGPLRADPDGHGTHVSGTIAATGANANGVTGVAWNVQLIPLQVSFWWTNPATGVGEWRWNTDAIVRAINWARTNNVDIINFSGGGGGDSTAIRNAINDFQGLFVAAAGNGGDDGIGDDNDTLRYYPSDYSRGQTFSNRFISVGAINNAGNRPNFSNWGATSVSVFAPGNGIWSTVPNAINAAGYASWNGTSMATPHVTGTAALMYSLYTSMSSNLTRAQRAAAVKTAIINNAVTNDTNTPLDGLCVANGRLNAFRAISSIAFTTTNIGVNNIRIDSLQTNLRTFITGELVLPDTINNRTVTEIGSSAFANSGMSQITIPASVTMIGFNAFHSNTVSNWLGTTAFNTTSVSGGLSITGLRTGVTLPQNAGITVPNRINGNTVVAIGNNAFNGVTQLSQVTLPSGITSIGQNAFTGTGLNTLNLLSANPPTLGSNAFSTAPAYVYVPNFNSLALYNASSVWHNYVIMGNARVNEASQAPVGYLDVSTPTRLAGWIYNSRVPQMSIGVHILVYNAVTGAYLTTWVIEANQYRPDVQAAGYGTGMYGFDFTIPTTYNYGIKMNLHAITGTGYHPIFGTGTKNTTNVTFNKQGGNGGTNSVLAGLNLSMPSATKPLRVGHDFKGYWTGVDGTGTQYYNSSMSSVTNWDITSSTITLFADWDICTETIGIYYTSGSASDYPNQNELAGSQGMTITYGSSVSFSAPSISGYEFQRWEVRGGYPRQTPYIATYSTSANISVTYDYVNTTLGNYRNVDFFAIYKQSSCVAEGTMVTLADGIQVAVEDLTGNESLLVWNMLTGSFDSAPILFIDSDPYTEYEIIHLYFSDGTEVKVISEHGFWDIDLNKYIFLRNDAAQYIGHWFNKQTEDGNGNMIWTAVQLVDVDVYMEYTTSWSPVTFGHLCYYVNGILSMPGATEGLINIFEVNAAAMQYDAASFAADIAAYGLFTYEEFAELVPIPEVIFEAFNGQYLKVSIGKGLIDMEGLVALIERYADFFTGEDANMPENQNGHDNGNHNGHGNGNQKGHRCRGR